MEELVGVVVLTEFGLIPRTEIIQNIQYANVMHDNELLLRLMKQILCLAVSCGQLPNLENGRVEGQNFDFPAEVKFSCNRGYCIEGSVTSNCQTSGKWSSEPPRCNRKIYLPLQIFSTNTNVYLQL